MHRIGFMKLVGSRPSVSRNMARLRRSACLILSCWLLILAPTAAGQDSTGLTLDLVQSRLDALKAAGEAESTLALRNDYNKVLQLLQQATDSLAAADNYSAALASAPKQEHEIRSRLQDAKEPDSVKLQAGYKALGLEQSEAEAALLESQLTAATDERDTLGKRLSSQESNEKRRRQRVLEIQSLSRDLPTEPVTVQVAASPSAKEAADWLMEAQRRALAAELRALEAASGSQPVRNALSRAQRAERLQLIRELDAKLEVLGTKIRLDREKQTDSVRHELERLQTDRPMLGFLAGTNLQLSERLRDLGQRVTVLDDCHKQMEQATAQLEERYAAARRRVEFARESTELGQILLAQSRETEAVLSQRRDCSAEIQISDLIIDRINFEERLQGMDSGARYLDQLVDQFPGVDGLSPTERQRALALADSQRKLLGDMVALQSQYIEASADIRASKTELGRIEKSYQQFLSTYLLWVPSHPAMSLQSIRGITREAGGLRSALIGLADVFEPADAGALLLLLVGVVLLLAQPRIRAWEASLANNVNRPRNDSILLTLAAIGATAVASLPWAVIVLALGRAIEGGAASGVVGVFQTYAVLLFCLVFLGNACRAEGLGQVHFNWHATGCERASVELKWIQRWCLPLLGLSGLLYQLWLATAEAAIVRLMIIALGALLLWRMLGHERTPLDAGEPGSEDFRYLLLGRRAIIVILVLVLAIVPLGYLHSATVLIGSLINTAGLLLVLLIIHATLTRWTLLARRRVRFRELIAARAGETAEDSEPEEERVDLQDIGEATTQLLVVSMILLGGAGFWFIWAPVLPGLSVLNDIAVWTTTETLEGQPVTRIISLATLLGSVLLVVLVFSAARYIPSLLELVLLQYRGVTAGTRYTITTLTNYVIVGGGVLMILGVLGLDWGKLQWLVAALGVGIGFGLQEIVANFISGLIILFERPVRIGDIVTIGDAEGVVTRIRIRATTLRDWNGKELLVPNKEFITGRLLNWSLSDPNTRIIINVGIAYGSDLEAALALLEKIVRANEFVLDDPEPSIIMSEFGDNALLLTARYYIGSTDHLWLTKNQLHRDIYREFDKAGIIIAFPQRDVHMDTAEPIRIAIEEHKPAQPAS